MSSSTSRRGSREWGVGSGEWESGGDLTNKKWQIIGDNWLFQIFKNKLTKQSPAAIAAMREHLRTDKYLTLSEARRIYQILLPGATVRKHLFWRYSMVWEKPLLP